MSYSAEFLEYYFRHMGVHTPLPSSFQPLFPTDGSSTTQTASIPPQVKRVATSPQSSSVMPTPVQPEPATAPRIVPEDTPTPVIAEVQVDSWQDLQAQVATCQRCALANNRQQTVFGTGDTAARLVFIGEAPGAEEDQRGEPFVGKPGQLFNRMLAAVGLDRSEVYIMNTIKCRPPWNRDPSAEEKAACQPWFEAQLRLLAPAHICLLGEVAAQYLLRTDASLASLRGRTHEYQGIPVTVTYHPSYLLRNSPHKKQAWEDIQRITTQCEAAISQMKGRSMKPE